MGVLQCINLNFSAHLEVIQLYLWSDRHQYRLSSVSASDPVSFVIALCWTECLCSSIAVWP